MIFGTVHHETLGNPLRVTVMATGLSSARKSVPAQPLTVVQQRTMHAVQQPVLRTGTDGIPVLNQVAAVQQADTEGCLGSWMAGQDCLQTFRFRGGMSAAADSCRPELAGRSTAPHWNLPLILSVLENAARRLVNDSSLVLRAGADDPYAHASTMHR